MEALNANEQREFQNIYERKQLKDFMTVYSRLIQNCFESCVNDFTSKTLASREQGCVMRCVDKHQKAAERVQLRFTEQNVALMQSGQIPGQ
ncbi:protein transporter tim9 [Xanthoria parietina]